MKWRKLSQVKLRYKMAIAILLAIYLSITVMTKKMGISSYFSAAEYQKELDRQFRLLTNQSEASLDVFRSDVVSFFSASASSLNVEVILIDPSILFNLLTHQQQNLLLKSGSNVTDFKYVPGIVTFGFLQKYRKFVTRSDFQKKMLLKGFELIIYSCNKTSSPSSVTFGHYFFQSYGWIIHLVEFERKLNYLTHSALPVDTCPSILKGKDLHFATNNGIYENFDGIVINKESKITLPSNLLRFLSEMKTSEFLKCRALLQPKEKHALESKVGNVIREMRAILHPHLYDFWITSGTLLGWYRECGVIPYTTDVDFGMRASDVKNIESILKLFRESKLKLVTRFGLAEEALELSLNYEGLRVDIFFFYEERNQSYVACHFMDTYSYAKVLYPPFSLCSAALLGEKVQVPCETETILKTEYGTNWTQPVSKWNWKNSFYNKGPEIHWDDSKKKQVYQHF